MFTGIEAEKKMIGHIPCLHIKPKKVDVYPTLLLYHGWTSNKENQLFLGSILASQGMGVIAPDAPFHGERGSEDLTAQGAAQVYFWRTVLQAVDEAPAVIGEICTWPDVDKDHLALAGISMGSILSSAVFMDHPQFSLYISFIGTGNWVSFARQRDPSGNDPTADQMRVILQKDPASRTELVRNRPVLLLHGDSDPLVDVRLQREFFDRIKTKNEENTAQMIETPGLGHFLELDMIEAAVRWLKERHFGKGE